MPLLPAPSRPLEDQLAALRDGAGARELDDAVLQVTGADRAEWLAGMATNDVRGLTAGQSKYTAFVHEKGKLLADGWVHARADDVLVCVPPDTLAALREHLERHIIMEDVELAPRADLRVVAVSGANARRSLEGAPGDVFDAARLGGPGCDLVLAATEPAGAWLAARVADGALVSADETAWETARLERGVPRWGVDFGTENYVQEAAITARAVSFSKGCYVGQEVVCRLEMRGHVRRQLVALALDGDAPPPAAGAKVGDVGAVTSAAYSPAQKRAVALAMVKWDVASAGGAVEVEGRPAQIVRP